MYLAIMSYDYLVPLLVFMGFIFMLLCKKFGGGILWGSLSIVCWLANLIILAYDFPLTTILFLGLIAGNIIIMIKGEY